MASGLLDKVKMTGNRVGSGAITDWVRVAPYRLPTDIANVNDVVLLECKLASDDATWERSWFTIGAGNQLTIHKVVDTYQRSGPYTGTPPSAVTDFDGPVEVGAVADSVSIPVIGPNGFFLNGAAVNSSIIAPDIATLQARNDLVNGQSFFVIDSEHIPSGGGLAGGGTGLQLRYDSGSGAASDYSNIFPMTSGLPGRLIQVPLKIPKTSPGNTIGAGGVATVVNANRAGGLWKLQAWSEDDALSYAECIVVGDASAPEIRGQIKIGDAEFVISGTEIRLKNNGLTSADFGYCVEVRN